MHLCRHAVSLSGGLARLAAAMLVALLAHGGASAEPGFSFAATPGKLPNTVVPTHYAIEL